MKRYRLVLLLIVMSISMILFSEKGIKKLKQYFNEPQNEENIQNGNSLEGMDVQGNRIDFTIVLDAGHGGYDPGKVGVNGALEKDINLSISSKLKVLLEKKGFIVVMTRTTDEALCSDEASYNKSADMKGRVKIIEEAKADITVSIHQNSFTSSSSKGAQVFYYDASEKSRQLADTIQEMMKELLDDGNKRTAKANSTYYLLRKTTCPIVIVECGFLSNTDEANLLMDEAYQNKVAEAVYEGILKYYNSISENQESLNDTQNDGENKELVPNN